MKARFGIALSAGLAFSLIGCGGGGEDAPPAAPSQAEAKAALEKAGDKGQTASPGVLKKKGKTGKENTPAKPD